jgi:hypothetical protein
MGAFGLVLGMIVASVIALAVISALMRKVTGG